MSRGKPLLWAVAFSVAGAGAGCKSDDDPGAAFISRYCDLYQPCCTAAGLPGDGKACRALFASAASPRAKYDGTAGEACLAGLKQSAGQPGFCAGDILPPSACAQAFGGAVGASCIQDGDCPASAQGDVHCVSSFVAGATVNKCQVQVRGQLGSSPCVGNVRGGVTLYGGTSDGSIPDQGFLCYADDGLRCNGTACVALANTGETCSSLSDECVAGDFCDASTGTCQARKPLGAACIDQPLECADGAYCDPGGMTCVAQLDIGAVCTDNGQCRTGNCAADGTCAATPSGGANPLCGG